MSEHEILVTEAINLGGDVLQVTGYVGGEPVQAVGWISVLTDHYDDAAYNKKGELRSNAEPRPMTADEAKAYCQQLLADVAGEWPAAEPKAPLPVQFDLDEAPEPEPEPESSG